VAALAKPDNGQHLRAIQPVNEPSADAHPIGTDSPPGSISLRVNGEKRTCPAGLMLAAVLTCLGYRPELVVVEFNGEILARDRWPGQAVGEADVLEVVTIVGGGS
jgi:sulfur carrier protein